MLVDDSQTMRINEGSSSSNSASGHRGNNHNTTRQRGQLESDSVSLDLDLSTDDMSPLLSGERPGLLRMASDDSHLLDL